MAHKVVPEKMSNGIITIPMGRSKKKHDVKSKEPQAQRYLVTLNSDFTNAHLAGFAKFGPAQTPDFTPHPLQ